MKRLEPYRPTPRDLTWAREMVRILRDGATIQTRHARYKIDKERKRITLEEPDSPWDNPLVLAMHHRHTCVWCEVGYEVFPKISFESDPRFELPDVTGREGKA